MPNGEVRLVINSFHRLHHEHIRSRKYIRPNFLQGPNWQYLMPTYMENQPPSGTKVKLNGTPSDKKSDKTEIGFKGRAKEP